MSHQLPSTNLIETTSGGHQCPHVKGLRIQEDIKVFSLCALSFYRRKYKGGASETPNSVPFGCFYDSQEIQW